MPLLRRKSVLAAKIETTSGTAESLAAADAAFNVFDLTMTANIPMTPRPSQGSFSSLPAVPELYGGTCSFRTEIYGDGAGGADAENDVVGSDPGAVGNRQREHVVLLGDLRDIGAITDNDALGIEAFRPAAEDGLAGTRPEIEIAAQVQEAGLSHDVLALLVLLDGLRVGAETFEQDVARCAQALFAVMELRPRGRAQSARPRADNSNAKMLRPLLARCHAGLLHASPQPAEVYPMNP